MWGNMPVVHGFPKIEGTCGESRLARVRGGLSILGLGFLLVFFASGCGGGGGDDSRGSIPEEGGTTSGSSSALASGTTLEKNIFVLERLREWYLWYDRIPANLEAGAFASPEAVLDAARYREQDKWSTISSAASVSAQLSRGEFTGVGVRTGQDADARLWINEVFSQSPAEAAGVRRGDRILRINGRTIAEINASAGVEDAFGASLEGVAVDLVLLKKDGTEVTLSLVKRTFIIDSVYFSKVIQQGTKKIAYMVYDSFTGASYVSLARVFGDFYNEGVTEMVLDLRYNSGGLVEVAAFLASFIRDASDRDVFALLQFNNRHADSNYGVYFSRMARDLNLSRVFIITSGSTCSASEMVIQGLKPYMTVVKVGSPTCGKPVGMEMVEFYDQVLMAVNFKILNASGEGDYYGGLAPDCAASDDLSHELGDTAESSLAAALSTLSGGACPVSRSRRSLVTGILSPVPKGLPEMGRDGMW